MWDWTGDGTADWYRKQNVAGKQDMLSKIIYSTGVQPVTYQPTHGQLGADSTRNMTAPTGRLRVVNIVNK